MLYSEFVNLTGFTPTTEYYYNVIEPEYMASNLDKQTWCRRWKRNGGIENAYSALVNEVRRLSTRVKYLENYLDSLF